jgi:hypothetical protein
MKTPASGPDGVCWERIGEAVESADKRGERRQSLGCGVLYATVRPSWGAPVISATSHWTVLDVFGLCEQKCRACGMIAPGFQRDDYAFTFTEAWRRVSAGLGQEHEILLNLCSSE